MQAQAVMTSPVVDIEPSASIADAARLMLSKKISGLPCPRSIGNERAPRSHDPLGNGRTIRSTSNRAHVQ